MPDAEPAHGGVPEAHREGEQGDDDLAPGVRAAGVKADRRDRGDQQERRIAHERTEEPLAPARLVPRGEDAAERRANGEGK
jgi:hypothetical protein